MGKVLSEAQIKQFEDNGYVYPVDCFTREQATAYLNQLESFEKAHGVELGKGFNFKPHLLFKWVDEVARHPKILDAVEDLIGPNIRLFHLSVWPKGAHSPAYIWIRVRKLLCGSLCQMRR